MIIVAGHLIVAPEERAAYLEGCAEIIRLARAAAGCLDFTIAADPVEPGRINVFERWESQSAVEEFRGSGPAAEQSVQIRSADVAEYDVADVRALT